MVLFTQETRKLGIISAVGYTCLSVVYAVILAFGLFSLQSPSQPVGDPYFTALEILIILIMPSIGALMVALHA